MAPSLAAGRGGAAAEKRGWSHADRRSRGGDLKRIPGRGRCAGGTGRAIEAIPASNGLRGGRDEPRQRRAGR